MNPQSCLCPVMVTLVLLFSSSVQAGKLNRQEVESLISGNTLEGSNLNHQEKMTWYFKKSGKIKKLDEHGNSGKGKWRIDDRGFLCVKFKRGGERCRVIVAKEYGGYKVIGTAHPEEGKLIWQINRVLPGNVNDL